MTTFSLKSSPDSHMSQISEAVSSLAAVGTDVSVISASGESIPANRSLLRLVSPFLNHLLSSLPCCAYPTIHLPDCSSQALKHLFSIISNGFTTSQIGNGTFIEINEVMDTAKFLNISLLDLSYERGPARAENEGVNDEHVGVKEEVLDDIKFDQQIPFKPAEDFINEENILSRPRLSSSQRSRTEQDMTSLLVKGLTYRTSNRDMQEMFERYGKIGDIHIPIDRFSGKSKRFAFVRFFEKRDANRALKAVNGKVFDGHELTIQIARNDGGAGSWSWKRGSMSSRRGSSSQRRRSWSHSKERSWSPSQESRRKRSPSQGRRRSPGQETRRRKSRSPRRSRRRSPSWEDRTSKPKH